MDLWGPVVLEDKDAFWAGARAATNNTGELCAIYEFMMWLRDEPPRGSGRGIVVRQYVRKDAVTRVHVR